MPERLHYNAPVHPMTGSNPPARSGSSRDLIASAEFRRLVSTRWRVSLTLTVLLFLLYYGYIILIAVDRAWLSRRIGPATTLGIPLGAAVIVGAWILTAAYVLWANRVYDTEAARLRDRFLRHTQDVPSTSTDTQRG
jgi:uncharacterized membrane protein (DUF485 family)